MTRLENHNDASLNRLAVLIDADNAQASVIENLLTEVARYGEATVKRIYGDFTSRHNSSWKKLLQKFAISPVQQFAYTVGKNSADSALIIDAMDLLYSGKLDGFCIVSSDSDFTGLANRIREEGLLVLGFGEKKTPEAFRMACKKFIFTEVLRPEKVQDKSAEKVKSKVISAQNNDEVKKQKQAFPTKIIQEALDKSADDSGWAYLGAFGSILNRLLPEFDARNYGFQKLSDMVKGRSNLFEIEERSLSGSNSKQIYVRLKSKKD